VDALRRLARGDLFAKDRQNRRRLRRTNVRDGAFVPVLANAGVGPQGLLDGADKEVDPQRKQDDYADGRQDGLERRVGQVRKEG